MIEPIHKPRHPLNQWKDACFRVSEPHAEVVVIAALICMRHQILVVHEEEAARDRLVAALDDAGFMGVPSANVHQALHYLQTGGTASVILLDEAAAWTTFRRARLDPKIERIPVITISRLGRSVAMDPVRKPIDVDMLITIVSRLCVTAPVRPARGQPCVHKENQDESHNVPAGGGRHELRRVDAGHVSRQRREQHG